MQTNILLKKVSWYHNIRDTRNENTATIEYLLNAISTGGKNNVIANTIHAVRNETDKNRRSMIKGSLPNATWQGCFSERRQSGLIESSLTGLMCIDIDHQPDDELYRLKSCLRQRPWTFAIFRSPSGDGLKVLVKTPVSSIVDYKNCYAQIIESFAINLGCNVDESCRDYAKTCYLSYDPDIYVNPDVQDFPYRFDPKYDFTQTTSSGGGNLTVNNGTFVVPAPSISEQFQNKLSAQIQGMNDERIINICDIRFHRYKQNYTEGRRRDSVYQQAKTLCLAGIDDSKAQSYLIAQFVPVGLPEYEIRQEVYKAYAKYNNVFGSKRGIYLNYQNYKNSHPCP